MKRSAPHGKFGVVTSALHQILSLDTHLRNSEIENNMNAEFCIGIMLIILKTFVASNSG